MKKIERYFGKVEHVQSSEKLPDGHYDLVMSTMLNIMKSNLSLKGVEVSVPTSLDEFHQLIAAKTPKEYEDEMKDVESVFGDIMSTLAAQSPGTHEKRNEWYARLKVVTDTKKQSIKRTDVPIGFSRIMSILDSLIDVCLGVSSSHGSKTSSNKSQKCSSQSPMSWADFWNNIFAPVSSTCFATLL